MLKILVLCWIGILWCDALNLDEELDQILSEMNSDYDTRVDVDNREERSDSFNTNFNPINIQSTGNVYPSRTNNKKPFNWNYNLVKNDQYAQNKNYIQNNKYNEKEDYINNEKGIFEEPENTDCQDKCVPFYQCDDSGKVVTNGNDIIDMRINDGPCGNAFLICCKLDKITTKRYLEPSSSQHTTTQKGCGYRNPNGVGFKIMETKENEAQFAEFPWMVSIFKDDGIPTTIPSCGGSLIHPQAVLTAAHCIRNKKINKRQRWKVRVGEWDINKMIEPIPYQEVEVETVVIHKDYLSGALYNDIAFLYLKTPIREAENAATICIPPQNYHHRLKRCFVTGWGKDRFGKLGHYSEVMKKIDLPLVPREQCERNLRKTRLGEYFELHYSFLCAGGEKGKDTCNGDGGGPLVCPTDGNPSRYYQAGIVSWGIGCGEENIPGVYTDVAQFRNWIDQCFNRFGLF